MIPVCWLCQSNYFQIQAQNIDRFLPCCSASKNESLQIQGERNKKEEEEEENGQRIGGRLCLHANTSATCCLHQSDQNLWVPREFNLLIGYGGARSHHGLSLLPSVALCGRPHPLHWMSFEHRALCKEDISVCGQWEQWCPDLASDDSTEMRAPWHRWDPESLTTMQWIFMTKIFVLLFNFVLWTCSEAMSNFPTGFYL